MVVIKLSEEEKEQFRTMFAQLVGVVKQNPEITREELVNIAVSASGISETTINEWIEKTIQSLYADGVIVEPLYDLMRYHFTALKEEFVLKLADAVLAYVLKHPLSFMFERAKAEIELEISHWEQEPDEVPNETKFMSLEALRQDLEALEEWQSQ